MNVFVDADACPVVSIVEQVAKQYNIPVTLLCDTNHMISSDYSEVKVIGAAFKQESKKRQVEESFKRTEETYRTCWLAL